MPLALSYLGLAAGLSAAAALLSLGLTTARARKLSVRDEDLTRGMAFNRRTGRIEVSRRLTGRAFDRRFGRSRL